MDSPAKPSNDLVFEQARVEVVSRSMAMGAQPNQAPALLKYSPTPFQRTYFNKPAAFVMDCIRWEGEQRPTDYQLEICSNVVMHKREAARGPHGLGKTAIAAWLVHWFGLTRDGQDWKLPTTAGAWRQLQKYLWPEIHKWARQLNWDKIGRQRYAPSSELLQLNLKLKTGEAFAAASENFDLIEGAHADHLLYIYDESKAIPEATFDASEGAFAGGENTEAYALAISTPGEPLGRFYDIHSHKVGFEDWHTRHVTLAEAIKAGRINPAWAAQRLRQWGENSALYKNRVEGEFFAGDETGVIPLGWVEAANDRWRDWKEAGGNTFTYTATGVDVAGEGGKDSTALALRFENAIDEIRMYEKQDTMATSGIVSGIIRARGGYGVIDSIGIGAGVLHKVRENQLPAHGFVASAKCEARDITNEFGFVNLRSAAWWHFREMLDPSNDEKVMLPPDDELTQDLTTPRWRVNSSGKIEVESKGETVEGGKGVIARLGRSTDKGDAVVMSFCPRAWMKSAQTALWIAV
jgi:hypothetical protein